MEGEKWSNQADSKSYLPAFHDVPYEVLERQTRASGEVTLVGEETAGDPYLKGPWSKGEEGDGRRVLPPYRRPGWITAAMKGGGWHGFLNVDSDHIIEYQESLRGGKEPLSLPSKTLPTPGKDELPSHFPNPYL